MGSARPMIGVSAMPQRGFALATRDLFAAGQIDAVEWTVDLNWHHAIPKWLTAILDAFASTERLFGHGLGLAPQSVVWTERRQEWLAHARASCARWPVRGFAEHMGVSLGGSFVDGPPLPTPRSAAALNTGREGLRLLAEATGVQVGLENLALAFCRQDALDQGPFLEALLAPVNGYVLLDVHNLYCQLVNFELTVETLLERYPLHRVRAVHIAGGHWFHPPSDRSGRRFRRDTHDHAVPEAVWALLPQVLARCPHVEVVLLERIGTAFATEDQQVSFTQDFHRLRAELGAA